MIDSELPDIQECQHFEETKTYKDEEVQVNYLVHLTGQYKTSETCILSIIML